MHSCNEVEVWNSHGVGSSGEHEMATWQPSITWGGPVQSPYDARWTMSVHRCESRSTDKRTLNSLEQAMAQRVNTQVTISMRMRRITYVEWQMAIILFLTGQWVIGLQCDWNVTQFILANTYKYFGKIYCFHLHKHYRRVKGGGWGNKATLLTTNLHGVRSQKYS